MTLFIVSLLGYLVGSIPFGLVLVYLFTGKNLKHIGSGNIGTTNVLRTSGITLALITLILDSCKAFIVVYLSKYYGINMWYIPGVFVVLGHIFSIWIKFSGGKGVATTFGFILAIDPVLFLITIFTWLIVALFFKFSSLAAIITFLFLPFDCLILNLNMSLIITLTILSIIIIIKHKSNIFRLINKTEDRLKLIKK